MFDGVRLITVHPALVHLPLGIAALAALTFCWARLRSSPRWGFVADVALWASAATAFVAGAFGFVSFFVLSWPGGLGPWPALHLAFGSASAGLLLLLGAWRARQRRQGHSVPSWGDAGAMLVVGAVIAFTGWVGGELLVFHSGMAVAAAGDGALAPALSASSTPDASAKVLDVMGDVRGAFATIETDVDAAIVNGYDTALWQRTSSSAAQLQRLAQWLEQQKGGDFRRYAAELSSGAEQLQSAAAAQKFSDLVAATGSIQHTCAACHEQTRWAQH